MCQLFLEGRGMPGLGLTFSHKDQYQKFGRFGQGSYSKSVLAVLGRICDEAFAWWRMHLMRCRIHFLVTWPSPDCAGWWEFWRILQLQIIFRAMLWCLWCFQLAALHPWVGSFAGAATDRGSARLIEVFAQIRCFSMFLPKMKMKPKQKPNLLLGPAWGHLNCFNMLQAHWSRFVWCFLLHLWRIAAKCCRKCQPLRQFWMVTSLAYLMLQGPARARPWQWSFRCCVETFDDSFGVGPAELLDQ